MLIKMASKFFQNSIISNNHGIRPDSSQYALISTCILLTIFSVLIFFRYSRLRNLHFIWFHKDIVDKIYFYKYHQTQNLTLIFQPTLIQPRLFRVWTICAGWLQKFCFKWIFHQISSWKMCILYPSYACDSCIYIISW